MSSVFSVRFLLANNLPTSVTRLTAEMSNTLIRLGVPIHVSFPAIDWLDFKLFGIRRVSFNMKWRWAFRLAAEAARNRLFPKTWCGFTRYGANLSIQAGRYFIAPPLREDRTDEILVVHHPYLLPRLLNGKSASKKKIVAVIHNNYELEIQSPWAEASDWKKRCVRLEQSISVPRVATSEEARGAAERLGIPVRRVISGGIDLSLFKPAERSRRTSEPLKITLYCATNPQKGQQSGIEAIRGLKQIYPRVQLCSLGDVLPGSADLFDHHYGFLHGQDYVRAIQESDIFIYPSLYDGFPAPPLQAMACGTALVTTAVEGVTAYAVDGENCLLARPGDPMSLKSKIRRILQDEALRQRLQSKGPRTAETFSVEQSAKQWLGFFKELNQEELIPLEAA